MTATEEWRSLLRARVSFAEAGARIVGEVVAVGPQLVRVADANDETWDVPRGLVRSEEVRRV